MGNTQEAITKLVELLDTSPSDAEAWAELADLYLTQRMNEQAIFCLEEVLLIQPNAWNVSTCGTWLCLSVIELSYRSMRRLQKSYTPLQRPQHKIRQSSHEQSQSQ
jgi:tetratricopeptide (TPR) repeat protein